MNRDEYARLKDIVAGALSRPEVARLPYIAEQCGSDAAARAEVESLVQAALCAAELYEDPELLVAGSRVTREALACLEEVTLPFLSTPAGEARETGQEFVGTPRYGVRRRIGSGATGVVYEVDDRMRHQIVALKALRRRSGDDLYQLKREFRNVADIAHANLVSLYDLVVEDEMSFFTMELVPGSTFVDYVRGGNVDTETHATRVRHVLPQLVDAVAELHRRGLQHRD